MESLLDIKEERYRYLGNRNKAMIGVLIYQGVTSKELIELKIEDIDLDSGTITIKGQRKNANRTLALKTNQIIILMRYIEQDRPMLVKSKTNKLFIGKTGTPFSVDALHGFINKLIGLRPTHHSINQLNLLKIN